MRIITKAEWEWDGTQYVCVHQESEDYEGPVALCGGGSSAPKPDPLIGKAAMKQADLADEMLTWYKTDYAPKQSARLEKQDSLNERYMTNAMNIQQKQQQYADESMERMRTTFRPVEDSMVADAMQAGSAADQERYAARAGADVRQATARNRQAGEARLQAMGLNPASGAYAAVMSGAGSGDALNEATAVNNARIAAEQLGWAKRADVANMGRGLASQQATATQLGMSAGASGISATQQGVQNWSALGNQGIGAYGQSAGMWGNAGQLAGSTYGTQVNAWGQQQSADAQEAAGIGSAVGTAAMAAAIFMM